MPHVRIYTAMLCPYCSQAKKLLREKGVAFEEIDLTMKPRQRAELAGRAGGRTSVPQIWIGETHVGGCDDLYALNEAGRLDAMLAA
jgi:glutaredoxin 3